MRAALSLALLLAAPAAAQMVADRPALTLAGARAAVAAAEAEAVRQKLKVSIAVVDPGGNPILHQRMDEASLASIGISLDKARTSMGFNAPTGALQDRLNAPGGLSLLKLPGTLIDGAVPIRAGGRIVGAIGVSGATAQQDGQVAAAGAAAIQ